MNDDHRIACERLCMDFASFVDARRYDELVALFAEDGSFSPPGATARGHAELAAFFARRPADIVSRHLCTTIRVEPEVDGHADGTSAVLMFRGTADGSAASPLKPTTTSVVDYRDIYVRTADGWRIASRSASVVFDLPPASSPDSVIR